MTNSISVQTQRTLPPLGVLGRVYVAAVVVNLPLLALLLTPQLMRSRVGSATLLAFGTVLLIALLVAAVIIAPAVSARVAPVPPQWLPDHARSRVRSLYRLHRRECLVRLAELVLVYLSAQAVGGIVAWVMPYIWHNPNFGLDPAAGRWMFNYPNFAVQAVSIYLVTCVALAWYASRLRQLALRPPA